jgi:hypothetical protein
LCVSCLFLPFYPFASAGVSLNRERFNSKSKSLVLVEEKCVVSSFKEWRCGG